MARIVKLVTCIALTSWLFACNKNGGDASDQQRFDSMLAKRDSVLGRARAQRDSLAVIIDSTVAANIHSAPTPVRNDSDLRERPITVPAGVAITPTNSAPIQPAARKPVAAGAVTNPMQQRALAMGDSIARANAARTLGVSGGVAGGDSVRGIIEIRGNAPRVVLKTASRLTVTLSGMATAGIEDVGGTEVVVRGLKVSSQDIVVKSFLVRAVKGVPALDGRLDQSASGWTLTLTDNGNVVRLSAVPGLLQQAAGARVWITTAPNSNVPTNYGLIGTR